MTSLEDDKATSPFENDQEQESNHENNQKGRQRKRVFYQHNLAWEQEALDKLQSVCESMVTELFIKAYRIAKLAGRETVTERDIQECKIQQQNILPMSVLEEVEHPPPN